MSRVLITAFKPYGEWQTNASWLALVDLTQEMPPEPQITTRLYPVNFSEVRQLLATDLADNYDLAIHVGQAPGSECVQLEAIGLNVGREANDGADFALVDDGPVAYRTPLPLDQWAQSLTSAGVPTRVSYHAGTYLCNATLYLSQHLSEVHAYQTQSLFIHVPLAPSQLNGEAKTLHSLPVELASRAIRLILEQCATRDSETSLL